MKKPPLYWNQAKVYLSKKDKVLKNLILNYKTGHLVTRNDVFFSLCKSIIGQQISVAAANSVFLKFKEKCKGQINPRTINTLSAQSLKQCGLSRQKVKGIKNLAKRYLNKSFNPNLLKKMSDEQAIEYLSELRQIGRWSAEMILLFTFNRPNIWPVQDIGLLRAISNNYKKKYFPPKLFVNKLYKKFTPYCSVATWYLWRSIDNEPIQY
ncbi:MAG: DNA-3-methyladenine glycosylase 2 family protein [Proteobacteria bacterium]|jgi:DNA-3-methyladenine glycosylase II|nr:DNA-3-methyladenine glycosylase 2 family protein [Pseudomonadota bacterium]